MILSEGAGGLSRKFTLGVVTVAASAVNCDCFFRVDPFIFFPRSIYLVVLRKKGFKVYFGLQVPKSVL